MKIVKFLSKVDQARCTGDRLCEKVCPSGAIKVVDTKGSGVAKEGELGCEGLSLAPCANACPSNVNVAGYVALVEAGQLKDAYNLIRKENPFPAVCGRICTHPCEKECNRGHPPHPYIVKKNLPSKQTN